MRHRSVQSRAGSLTAAAVLAVGFGVSAAQAGFVLDLTIHGGGIATTVSSGAVVNLDVWGTVTGADSNTANEGIQDAFFGVTNSGGHGDLGVVTLNSPFTGIASDGTGVTTSSGGTLYGAAGSKSVGSTDSTSADGWVFARSTAMTTSPTVTSGIPVLLGQLQFTAGASGTANLAINARQAVNSLVIPAVWQEDGSERDNGSVGGNGTLSIGSGVSITVAALVSHINGNTPFNNYDNGSEVIDLNDLAAVLNNFGTTNAAGYAWPRVAGGSGVGSVDLNDLALVLNNFGNHSPAPSGLELAAVPEPTSLGLLGLGATALIRRRRR